MGVVHHEGCTSTVRMNPGFDHPLEGGIDPICGERRIGSIAATVTTTDGAFPALVTLSARGPVRGVALLAQGVADRRGGASHVPIPARPAPGRPRLRPGCVPAPLPRAWLQRGRSGRR